MEQIFFYVFILSSGVFVGWFARCLMERSCKNPDRYETGIKAELQEAVDKTQMVGAKNPPPSGVFPPKPGPTAAPQCGNKGCCYLAIIAEQRGRAALSRR